MRYQTSYRVRENNENGPMVGPWFTSTEAAHDYAVECGDNFIITAVTSPDVDTSGGFTEADEEDRRVNWQTLS